MKRLLLILLLALPLHAGDFELGIQHVAAVQTGALGDLDIPLSRGFSATGEWFFNERVSTQFAATFINPEAFYTPNDTDLGTLGIDVYSLTARYHFRGASRISPFAGAGAGLAVFGNLDDRFGTDLEAEFDAELAPIVEGGVRYRFRRGLVLSAALRYMPVTATTEVVLDRDPNVEFPEEIELNPVMVSVGVSWRF